MEFPPKSPVPKLPETPAEPEFTSGIPKFSDTFFGPNDKNYQDRKVLEMARLRGFDCFYYKLIDQTERVDGIQPLTNQQPSSASVDEETFVVSINTPPHPVTAIPPSTRSGNVSFYGEPVVVMGRIDSTKREVAPSWNYAEPVLLRCVGLKPEAEEDADERGTITVKKLTLHIPRALMEKVNVYPRSGDVIRLPNLLDSFYDVVHVDRNTHRFGGFGFYTAFKFDLLRKSIFTPERKLQGD